MAWRLASTLAAGLRARLSRRRESGETTVTAKGAEVESASTIATSSRSNHSSPRDNLAATAETVDPADMPELGLQEDEVK